jgi:hypothetical protein
MDTFLTTEEKQEGMELKMISNNGLAIWKEWKEQGCSLDTQTVVQ